MRVLGTIFLPIALAAGSGPAAADGFPGNGAGKFAASQVCHPLAAIEMGAAGSESFTECNGIVRNANSQTVPDNLLIRCLEHASNRPGDYKYAGDCVQTDADGDKLFMTYGGSATGQMKWIGGTGKYADITGSGAVGVVVAPASTSSLFAYTLNYDVTWTHTAK